jgi:hypothetical protein
MARPNGTVRYVSDKPYLVILGARKSDVLKLYSSDAELLGQMQVLLQQLYTPLHRLLIDSVLSVLNVDQIQKRLQLFDVDDKLIARWTDGKMELNS